MAQCNNDYEEILYVKQLGSPFQIDEARTGLWLRTKDVGDVYQHALLVSRTLGGLKQMVLSHSQAILIRETTISTGMHKGIERVYEFIRAHEYVPIITQQPKPFWMDRKIEAPLWHALLVDIMASEYHWTVTDILDCHKKDKLCHCDPIIKNVYGQYADFF